MIELKNLSAGYGGDPVLHGISARLQGGRLTSIVGPNGSGKSTLLKTVLGMLSRSSGEITVDGRSIIDLGRRELARHVAYLP